MSIIIYDEKNPPKKEEKLQIINFLYENLEKYGDPKNQIEKAIDYSLKERESFGGLIIVVKDTDKIVGASVINKTGMEGYIPENILVYIATDAAKRGQGIGKKIMETAINECEGDIALHVEANNPAKKLYEKMGFTNPYLEMRLKVNK